MPLPSDITAIAAHDLQRLCDDQERESRHLEFKTDCTFNEASEKIRFLAGISSFANSDGGDFLIGIPATDGIPTIIQGIPATDLDARILQLTQIINDGITPRPHHHIQPITISPDRAVILVRVTKSWNAPHRVTFGGHDKFYARNSAGKHPMDLAELRQAFTLTSTIATRIGTVHQDLRSRLLDQHVAAQLTPGALLIIHVIPYASLDPQHQVSLQEADAHARLLEAPDVMHIRQRYNIDGIIVTSNNDQGRLAAYTQLHRSGIIESVTTTLLSSNNAIPHSGLTTGNIPSLLLLARTLAAIRRYRQLLQKLAIPPPIAVIMTLTGIKDYTLAVDRHHNLNFVYGSPIDRPTITLPSVVIQRHDEELANTLRPLYDGLWQAAGWDRCREYDNHGTLTIDKSWFRD